MKISPMSFMNSLQIGTVDFVSPNEIIVLLDIETPDSVALNTGTPHSFPRINSYVFIRTEQGYIVGQVEWITIERSAYPKRQGLKDFGLVDLPFPLRKMKVNPIGTLFVKQLEKEEGIEPLYCFRRGIEIFPSVGDAVLLPTQMQLRAMIESGTNHRVKIGTSPLNGNAEVKVDPDKLFGRHLAVLGNTGSGKSCSVAGLVRWSLEQAKTVLNNEQAKEQSFLNARFIILDPNGEYARAFSEQDSLKATIFSVAPPPNNCLPQKELKVPFWFWNSTEWCSIVQASDKIQKPILVQALRYVRDDVFEEQINQAQLHSYRMRKYLRTLVTCLKIDESTGAPWAGFPKSKNFYEKLKKWREWLHEDPSFSEEECTVLCHLSGYIDNLLKIREVQYPVYEFSGSEISELLNYLKNTHRVFGGNVNDFLPKDADIPIKFSGDALLKCIESTAEIMNCQDQYVEPMLLRIKTLLSDSRMKSIIGGNTNEDCNITLESWVKDYIGDNDEGPTLNIIDLSLVPSEVIHIITAVIARMIFESLQRYRKQDKKHSCLPTVLVMEEAHTFIKRYAHDSEYNDASSMCCKIFEKIAREGRKFGLGLVLSSQRPSELSPTVLSQCNTFLLHRISNDKDQELVYKLVPDNLRGLLSDLPSLPSQNAILLGWATELPIFVKMNSLPKKQQPLSDDPDFWDVWVHREKRDVDWKSITEEWQKD